MEVREFLQTLLTPTSNSIGNTKDIKRNIVVKQSPDVVYFKPNQGSYCILNYEE